jgi:hypothetical protein
MKSSQPIFQPVFGDSWHTLPPVLKRHYANRPFSHDQYQAKGTLAITFGWFATMLSPLFSLFGALVPQEGTNIPVTVWFKSEPDSNAYRFERSFHFPNEAPYFFQSRLVPLAGNELIEYVKYGIGWKHRCYFDGTKVVLAHLGYVWTFKNRVIPIPLSWILGRGYAEEIPLNNRRFAMKIQLTHPLLGKLYEYRGEFEMTHE